jgi:hypothetical protein
VKMTEENVGADGFLTEFVQKFVAQITDSGASGRVSYDHAHRVLPCLPIILLASRITWVYVQR